MAAAAALASRGRGRSTPNPNVGCIVVANGRVVGRGWTQPGGRPHAEAMALAQAGDAARGATLYATLEPCAHISERGPACCDLIVRAGIARVVSALTDPDRRTNGDGHRRLRDAGIDTREDIGAAAATRTMAGFLTRLREGRPHVTLKLATSLDGAIALASGESKWITGAAARAHGHVERARHDAILVGRATYDADAPRLDVRLPGLERFSPRRMMLTRTPVPAGWEAVRGPDAIRDLANVDHLLIEGGAQTAAAFLRADLVDRMILYRAPILVGAGKPALGDIALPGLDAAHGRWSMVDQRMLGIDRLEVYERAPCSPE